MNPVRVVRELPRSGDDTFEAAHLKFTSAFSNADGKMFIQNAAFFADRLLLGIMLLIKANSSPFTQLF